MNLKRNQEVETKRIDLNETKEAVPELRRGRLETKEEASKRKDVWKTKGKGANFKKKRDELKRKGHDLS